MLATTQNSQRGLERDVNLTNRTREEKLSEIIFQQCCLSGDAKTWDHLFYSKLRENTEAVKVLSEATSVRRHGYWIEVEVDINPELLVDCLVQRLLKPKTDNHAEQSSDYPDYSEQNLKATNNSCKKNFDPEKDKIKCFVDNFLDKLRSRSFILFVEPEFWLRRAQLTDEAQMALENLINDVSNNFCGLIVTRKSTEVSIKQNLEEQGYNTSNIKLVFSESFLPDLSEWLEKDDIKQKISSIDFNDDVAIYCALKLLKRVENFDQELPLLLRPGPGSLDAYDQALGTVKEALKALLIRASELKARA